MSLTISNTLASTRGWVCTALLTVATLPTASAQCREWTPGFYSRGMDAPIRALHVHDDGAGPRLLVGGDFTIAGASAAQHIASFDGDAWSVLGTASTNGANSRVGALLHHDDGSGMALFAGGNFTEAGGVFSPGVARWNGTSWSSVSGTTDNEVVALAVFDDGAGPMLYAGGFFTLIGGVPAAHLAKWNGTAWSPVGGGTSNAVRALHVHDDGSGPELYVGGDFSDVGGVTAPFLARWNGTSWSFPAPDLNGSVFAMTTWSQAGVRTLAVGGAFSGVSGVPCSRVAQWNGTSWSALGSGVDQPVRALRALDDGSGIALWVGGEFTTAGGITVRALAKWNGTGWSDPGASLTGADNGSATRVDAITNFDDGSGPPKLYVGGTFTDAAGQLVNRIASWNGTTWSGLGAYGNGLSNRWFQTTGELAVLPEPDGPVLCAAGKFETAGGVAVGNVARWNGTSWSPMGALVSSTYVQALTVLDVGAGPELFVTGSLAGIFPNALRWNGSAWQALGSVGFAPKTFAAFDDGHGTKLYAGGYGPFGDYVGPTLGRWNGTSWEALAGGGFDQPDDINAMVVFDDGTGPALYVGGFFFNVGNPSVPAWMAARWNGTSWTGLGTSTSGLGTGITAFAVFDDGSGSGPRLYASGTFTGGFKRWDGGTTWTTVGTGIANYAPVYDFEVFDDGSGPALYATGGLNPVNGAPQWIARWNGTTWSTVGTGLDGAGSALATYDDGSGEGPALYVAGGFTRAGDVVSSRIARWGGCRVATFCAGDGLDPSVTTPCPCANTGAPGRGCAWSGSSTGAVLEVDGRIDPDTIVLRGSSMPATTTAIYLKGDANASAGIVFGDGVRCVDGALIRLAIKQNAGGASQFPEPGNLSVSVRGGTPPGSGLTGWYQTYYRSASASFCPPATFNVTNGVRIRW